jgi:PHP family Zn ribbon phosphoesterase
MLGICDHNSAENVKAAIRAGGKDGITVIPGMEVTTAEEVHLMALFPRPEGALKLQRVVYLNLPPGENQPNLFGDQIIANEFDDVEGFNPRLLSAAISLTVDEVILKIHKFGGLAIASHIDRETNGIIGQLGFVPDGLAVDGLEISSADRLAETSERNPEIGKYPVLTASDAHFLDDIGRCRTYWTMAAPTFSEIRLALLGVKGRYVGIKV